MYQFVHLLPHADFLEIKLLTTTISARGVTRTYPLLYPVVHCRRRRGKDVSSAREGMKVSHHFDSPTGREDPRLNLCDAYLFPGSPGYTVMAMTVNADAGISAPDTFRM